MNNNILTDLYNTNKYLDEVRTNYKKEVGIIKKCYEETKDEYNMRMSGLNTIRVDLRREIDELYEFLNKIGNVGDKVTIWDYTIEKPAPVFKNDVSDELHSPLLKDGIGQKRHNREVLKDQTNKINIAAQKYYQDIQIKKTALAHLKVATQIVEIYFQVVTFVKDFVRNKIIPELAFINAFMIADSVKDEFVSGGDLSKAKISNIVEYKNTNKEPHFIFVQNAHDFYVVVTKFFKEPVISKFLEDGEISIEEEKTFASAVEEIYSRAEAVAKEKVI